MLKLDLPFYPVLSCDAEAEFEIVWVFSRKCFLYFFFRMTQIYGIHNIESVLSKFLLSFFGLLLSLLKSFMSSSKLFFIFSTFLFCPPHIAGLVKFFCSKSLNRREQSLFYYYPYGEITSPVGEGGVIHLIP